MVKANNLSDLTNTSTARTNLGLGTLATQNGTFSGTSSGINTGDQDLSGLMVKANNLSDLTNTTTARTNLGLGTLATQNGTFSGTSSGTNTGDQTITLQGDIAGSGTGTFTTTIQSDAVTGAEIQNGSVTTDDIADGTVTYGDIQNVTDNTLLGRSAGSNGTMQEITIGSGLSMSGGTLSATGGSSSPNYVQSNPITDPTGTTNTTGVMMGLGATLTPSGSGTVIIIISGDIRNNTSTDGAKVQIRYGTGSAPSNGAAQTGNAAGFVTVVEGVVQGGSSAILTVPFSLNGIVSGLSVGTQIWIDVSLAAITGGTAEVKHLNISAYELK
jgi:hypothetical protein